MENQHSIIVKDNQVLLSLGTKNLAFIGEENLTRLFAAFNANKIHINLMQHSAVSFSVCFDHHAENLKNLLDALEDEFQIKYNVGLQLITLRHYFPELIAKMTKNKKIFLEQRSRSTFQVLLK
jgi:aspartate kinase